MDETRDMSFWNKVEFSASTTPITEIQKDSNPEKFSRTVDRYLHLLGGKDVSFQTFRQILENNSKAPGAEETKNHILKIHQDLARRETMKIIAGKDNPDMVLNKLQELTGLDEDLLQSYLQEEGALETKNVLKFVGDNLLSSLVLESFVNVETVKSVKQEIPALPVEIPAGFDLPLPSEKKEPNRLLDKLEITGDDLNNIGEGAADALDVTKMLSLMFGVDLPNQYGFSGRSSLFRDGLEAKNDKTATTVKALEKVFKDPSSSELFFQVLLEKKTAEKGVTPNLVKELHQCFSMEGADTAEKKAEKVAKIKEKMVKAFAKLQEAGFEEKLSLEDLNISGDVMKFILLKAQEISEADT